MAKMVLPQYCPGCAQPYSYGAGLCGHRQLQAIALQAMRAGVELPCDHCGQMFVVGTIEELTNLSGSGQDRRKPARNVGSRIRTR